jgi:hypothetical protein
VALDEGRGVSRIEVIAYIDPTAEFLSPKLRWQRTSRAWPAGRRPSTAERGYPQAARRSSGNASVFLRGKSTHTSVAPPLAETTSGVSAMDSVK